MTAPQSPDQPVRRPAWGDMLWMIGFGAVIFAMVLALAAAMVPAAELPVVPKGAAAPAPAAHIATDPALVFVIESGSRLYPDWKEERRVHVGEPFVLGDTKNVAAVEALYPDFLIVDGKAVSLSDSLNNPAVRILVRRENAVVDSTWAFLNFPPHFSPKSFFTFQLKDIQGWKGPGPARPATAMTATTTPHTSTAATAGTAAAKPAPATASPADPKKKPSPAQKPE